jgi:serine/threonine protein kinase
MNDRNKDDELLAVLDDYLARLQSGQQPSRESLLEERPDLASALDCLDALDSLAPSDPPSSQVAGEPTIEITEPVANLPRTFGQYELLDEIGRGGMGVVYMARQSGLDRSVAIKMILAGHMASREHVRRFQAEATQRHE